MATNRDYYSQLLIAWSLKLKLKMFMTVLIKIKKMLDFSDYSAKSKYYDDSYVLIVGKR